MVSKVGQTSGGSRERVEDGVSAEVWARVLSLYNVLTHWHPDSPSRGRLPWAVNGLPWNQISWTSLTVFYSSSTQAPMQTIFHLGFTTPLAHPPTTHKHAVLFKYCSSLTSFWIHYTSSPSTGCSYACSEPSIHISQFTHKFSHPGQDWTRFLIVIPILYYWILHCMLDHHHGWKFWWFIITPLQWLYDWIMTAQAVTMFRFFSASTNEFH